MDEMHSYNSVAAQMCIRDSAGTIDEVALKLASLVKNSTSHWNYIGSPEYTYIAVGVTYESGMWYCAITVASENTYE